MSYQFPDMPMEEAIHFFNTEEVLRQIVGNPLKEIDFRKPDPQRWMHIFGGLFELLTSVPYDTIRQEVLRLLMVNNTEYSEIYEEAEHLCLFVLYMGRLLAACGVNDFVMKDITKPSTKRLLRILSALINFYKFKTGRIERFMEFKEKRERENDHKIQLIRANDELRQKINSIKANQAEKEPQILQLQNDVRKMNNKMAENYKVQTTVQNSISELKTKIAENKASSDQLRLQILQSKKLGDKLSKQIVQSPEKLQEEKKRTEAHLLHLKQTHQERIQRVLELRQQIERLKQLGDDSEQALKMMNEIVAEDEKAKECAAEIAKVQAEIQSTDEKIQDLCRKDQEIDTVIASKQEKISKLTLQHHHRMAGLKETLQQLQQQVEFEKEKKSNVKDEVKVIHQQIRAVEDEMEAEKDKHEQTMEKFREVYALSLEKLDGYHAKLVNVWQEAQPELDNLEI